MWFKDITSDLIVRFDSLTAGEVIIANGYITEGCYNDIWIPHNTTNHWTQIEEPKYFYVWEREGNGIIYISHPMTDEQADIKGLTSSNGWKKLEHTKRIGLNIKEIK